MWEPKSGEEFFTIKANSDFRFAVSKRVWVENDFLLEKAFNRGIIFKHQGDAFELARRLNKLLDNFKRTY